MKTLFTLSLLLSLGLAAAGQDSLFRYLRTVPGPVVGAFADNLDGLYLVTETGGLKKYNAAGDSVAVFNGLRQFGKLQAVDASNPLKLLLFYKDFSTIVILDRLLAVRATIDLRRQNILQVSAIGLSYDNNIWLFDELEHKLKKINESGELLLATPDFRQLFAGSARDRNAIVPQQITDRNGWVHLADSAHGIFVFDNLGTYRRKYPVTGWTSLFIGERQIVGLTPDRLLLYQPATLLQTEQPLPPNFKPYFHGFAGTNKFLLFANDGLRIYRHGF